jgi:hypothetical protein
MLYNQDLEHGLQIAQKGANEMPDKRFWYRQTAQIARWMGEIQTAKHYYKLLYQLEKSEETEKILMQLATATQDIETKISLLKSRLQNRYDTKIVQTLYRLFYDSGYLEEGADYFLTLLKEHPDREIAKALLLLLMEYAPFETIKQHYYTFRSRYGTDKTLTYRYARMLFSRKAYKQAFIELDPISTKLTSKDKEIWQLYADLALILSNESTLLSIFKKMEHIGLLNGSNNGLYLKLLKRYDPAYAIRYARKIYQKNPTIENFYTFAYLAVELKESDALGDLIRNVSDALKERLAEDPAYYKIAAWYYTTQKRYKKAINAYLQACKIAPLDKNLHQSYLWMLIDSQLKDPLKKELRFIERHIGCHDRLALPAALGYLRLGEGSHAKRCMKKVLAKDPNNWQYLLLYADILSLCGESRLQQQTMRRAWLIAKKRYDKNRTTPDKNSYYDYMRLQLHFDPLHANRYLKEAKERLDKTRYIDLALSVINPFASPQRARYLLNALAKPTPSQQMAKALLTQDETQLQIVEQNRKSLPLFDRLTLLKQTKKIDNYTSLLFQAMKQNPNNTLLAKEYTEYTTQKTPSFITEASTIKRGSLKERRFALRIKLPNIKNDALTLSYRRSRFRQNFRSGHHHAALTLEDSFKAFEIKASAGWHQKESTYTSYTVAARLKKQKYDAALTLTHGTDDESNNYMLLYGRKNSIHLNTAYHPDAYTSFAFNYSHNRYKDSNTTLGSSDSFELSFSRYIYRSYPDIYYRLFLAGADFTKNKLLPESYWQGGVEAGFGSLVRNRFQSTARPYATATLFYNSISGLGYALLAGAGERLFYHDRLGLELYYANGIDSLDESYLLLRLRYLYW